jgi:hypothetical protein
MDHWAHSSRYPAVLGTPETFFDDETDHAQRLVKKMQAGVKVRERLDESPKIREAYSYIKRWVCNFFQYFISLFGTLGCLISF